MEAARTILHVDLDAFFVSCELLRHPELAGLPVVVAGGGASGPTARANPGRAVVSAASYEARPLGVHSALPLAQALARCPELVVLPVDIGHYARISEQVFAVFHGYSPLVEPGSLDEAYLDVSGSRLLHGEGFAIARSIQARLGAELGLPASVGVAPSKTVAKIASDLRKPRGLVVVSPGEESDFLAPLEVARLPGAGPKTTARLHQLGIDTLGQLAQAPTRLLIEVLGPGAVGLQRRARGDDPSPVELPGVARSISREETYPVDLERASDLEARTRVLAAAVGRRLREGRLLAETVFVKLRFADFETITRRAGLHRPSCADLDLAHCADELVKRAWPPGRAVRLLGVGVEGLLGQPSQLGLFEEGDLRHERVDWALDGLKQRFGPAVITRGTDSLTDPLDWNRDHLRRLGPRGPALE
ncbi:MAG: DNA polymerase IV [Candidatus Dormibacteria bacterium]